MNTILFVILGLAFLFAGGEGLVRGAAGLGLRVGLSPLVVGLTIVAFGTSSPELAVSVRAATTGFSDVSIGNVVGSNICNLALILGVAALIRPVSIQSQVVRLDAPVAIGASVLFVAMLWNGRLTRLDGAILFAGLLIYLGVLLWLARREQTQVQQEFAAEIADSKPIALLVGLIVAGLVGLVVGGNFFVRGAVELARLLGVTEAVIGLTVVALGTSLPELSTAIVAAVRGHGDMVVGNVVGSNTFNVFFILGLSAMVTPLAQGNIQLFDLAFMLGVSIGVWPLLYTRRRLGRWEGAVLLISYFVYLAWQI